MLIQEQKGELVDMAWQDILKQNKTMADLSDSDRERLLKEKERYNRTMSYVGEKDPFEEYVNYLLSNGNTVDKIIERLDDEYNEWFDSSEGREWALSEGNYSIDEYYEEIDDLYRDSDEYDEMEEMERRREESANRYFSGGGYNTGDY